MTAFKLLLAALLFPLAGAVHAQAWPAKPVRFILPSPPASSPDRYTRYLAERLTQKWGVPVLVENKPGATAMIGTEYVAKQPADGYTFLSAFTSFVQAPILFKAPYDPEKDFAPVTKAIVADVIMEVRADSPYKTFADVIAAAKTGKVSYGSFGNGSSFHIYGEAVKRAMGVDMIHVPYKGEAAILTDLIGGQITVGFNSIGTALPQIRAGKVRPIAVVGARSTLLPDVPAFPELGVTNVAGGWFGIFAPAGTPAPVVSRLNAELVKIVRAPDVKARLLELGSDPVGSTPQEFARVIRAEREKWAKVIQEANVKPQ